MAASVSRLLVLVPTPAAVTAMVALLQREAPTALVLADLPNLSAEVLMRAHRSEVFVVTDSVGFLRHFPYVHRDETEVSPTDEAMARWGLLGTLYLFPRQHNPRPGPLESAMQIPMISNQMAREHLTFEMISLWSPVSAFGAEVGLPEALRSPLWTLAEQWANDPRISPAGHEYRAPEYNLH